MHLFIYSFIFLVIYLYITCAHTHTTKVFNPPKNLKKTRFFTKSATHRRRATFEVNIHQYLGKGGPTEHTTGMIYILTTPG